MDISIVIPAYNEESFIQQTIASINEWMPHEYSFEIVVVDHGSQDKTSALAIESGARVVNGKGLKTIASLRNHGVENTTGNLLFFIDADVTFTQQWSENISDVVNALNIDPKQVCGSLPRIPENSSLLMKYWFEPKSTVERPKYIGSCHLLTSRSLFLELGGFPSEMETGEDFNFCLNAKKFGAQIVAFPKLIIHHNGAPNTLMAFAKREVWHGRGDWTSITSILSSKVAILTIVFLLTHFVLLLALFNAFNYEYAVSNSIIMIIGICVFSSFIKFSKKGGGYVLINSFSFYIYFFSRALSLFSALLFRNFKKRNRSN